MYTQLYKDFLIPCACVQSLPSVQASPDKIVSCRGWETRTRKTRGEGMGQKVRQRHAESKIGRLLVTNERVVVFCMRFRTSPWGHFGVR